MEEENKEVTRRKFLKDSSKKALFGSAAAFLGFSMIKPTPAQVVGCADCTTSCSGACSGGCAGSCSGDCAGSCDIYCSGSCDIRCSMSCGSYCSGNCSGSCDSSCYGYCSP
jgi:hypothetical protein